MNAAVKSFLIAGFAAAVAGCATISGSDPADYDEHMAAARTAADAGSPRGAVAAYREAIGADPARKDPWLEIARVEVAQQRPVEALSAVQEVLRRDPADAEASMLYLDVAWQLALDAMARVRMLAPDQRMRYLDGGKAMVEDALGMFGDEVVPAEARARYGSEAVERYRRNLPTAPPDVKQPKVPDPLDVLGGR